MITETTRNCPVCAQGNLPAPPELPICPRCGHVGAPHHSTWSPRTKQFLAAAYASSNLLATDRFRTEHQSWEYALQMVLTPGSLGPNPFALRMASSAADRYAIAAQLAEAWRTSGALIVPHLLDITGRGAGLIAPSHPTQQRSA